MNVLAIDTSTGRLNLAISVKGVVKVTKETQDKNILSSTLMTDIQSSLKKTRLTFSDIDLFVVGLGPGSFTGLRIGLATLKGILFALQKPLIGVSSLDACAQGWPHDHSQICVIMDARRQLVYTNLYTKKNGSLVKKGKPRLTDLVSATKDLKREVIFLGDAISLYEKGLKHNKNFKAVLADQHLWCPRAQHLIPLALKRFQKKDVDNSATLVPLYLYPEDCQVTR